MAGYVNLDVGQILAILNSPAGPVAADIARRCVMIDRAAKNLCPVDTGRLKGSINWTLAAGEGITGRVGTDVKYAPYVEFGTRYMGAQPYLRPALRAGAG